MAPKVNLISLYAAPTPDVSDFDYPEETFTFKGVPDDPILEAIKDLKDLKALRLRWYSQQSLRAHCCHSTPLHSTQKLEVFELLIPRLIPLHHLFELSLEDPLQLRSQNTSSRE